MLRMLLCTALLAIASAVVLPAQAVSAIADFSVHGNAFGTYNMSQNPPPTGLANTIQPQVFGRAIENSEWLITVWLDSQAFFGANTEVTARYRFRAINKTSGVVQAPTSIGPGNFILQLPGGGFNIEDLRVIAPSITWTYAGNKTNGRDGFAIAIIENDPALLSPQVFVYFFELDTTLTPPTWVPAVDRLPVNASETGFGRSLCPSVVGMRDGDIVVVWQDDNPAGPTGGVPNINPVAPTANPGFGAWDIYARRFQQEFSSTGAAPGMIDGAVIGGQGSTVNVSGRAPTFDFWPHAVSDDGNEQVYVSWTAAGSEADDVAGIGPNSGPIGGVPFGETSDTYIRRIGVGTGVTSLSNANARNLSLSGTSGSAPAEIAYNEVTNQLAVTFLDAATVPGIGGFPNLSSVFLTNATTGAPIVANDLFLAVIDRLTLVPYGIANTSAGPDNEIGGTVAGVGINGWMVAYVTTVGASTASNLALFNLQSGNVTVQGSHVNYPLQTSLQNAQLAYCQVFTISSFQNTSISLHFIHFGGEPQHLRPGQPISQFDPAQQRPVIDAFIAFGESTAVPSTAGQLAISRVTINNDNPIDRAGGGILPAFIEVEIVVQNINGLSPMAISSLSLIPTQGFSVTALPTLPVFLAAGSSQTFVINVQTNPAQMRPGQNEFDVGVTGVINNIPTVATGKGTVAITGQLGSLTGVSVSAVINPTVFNSGTITKGALIINVANYGNFPLTDLKVIGRFIAGVTPVDPSTIVFTPDLSNAVVNSQDIRTYTGEVTFGASVPSRQYRPAFTIEMRQQSNTGSVTVMAANEITILPNPFANLGGPETGLVNRSPGNALNVDGCSLNSTRGRWQWLFLSLSGVLLAIWAFRRRADAR